MLAMNILIVFTSHDQLGETEQKTGFWLEEFAAPYYVLKDAGAATPHVEVDGKLVTGQNPASAGSCTRTSSVAERHSGFQITAARKVKGPGAFCITLPAHAISTKNKHLLLSCDTNPRFHGGSFGV
jgi:hypothetical protein